MNIRKKFFHIVFSYFLIFMPYLMLFDIISPYRYCYAIENYKFFYLFYIKDLIIHDAFGYWFIWKTDFISYVPTLIAISYLYLSCKVTYNFWKNQTKKNCCLLYIVNSILLSPIGAIITTIIFVLIKTAIKG